MRFVFLGVESLDHAKPASLSLDRLAELRRALGTRGGSRGCGTRSRADV